MRSTFTEVFTSRAEAMEFAQRFKDDPVCYTVRIYPQSNATYLVEVKSWSLD